MSRKGKFTRNSLKGGKNGASELYSLKQTLVKNSPMNICV